MAHLAEFGRIDSTANADYFVHFLDAACAQASFQAYKNRMNELLELAPGRRVLDVGCGTGDDVRIMAALVAPGGQAVGVDNSRAMIAEADKRSAATDLPTAFHLADTLALPFETASFDASRADRSLMHVPDPARAIAEMRRVTRPGGRIVVYEVDFGALTIDADDRVLARKIINTWSDSVRNGWLGRRMPRLFTEAGLRDIEVVPHTLMLTPEIALLLVGQATVDVGLKTGTITPNEAEAWLEHMDALQRDHRFFSTMTGFLVWGRV